MMRQQLPAERVHCTFADSHSEDIRRQRPTARGSASGKRGCGQQEIHRRFVGNFPNSRTATTTAQRHHFLWVSEVTLGRFWLLFGAFSVLHCHVVSLSARCLLVRRKSSFSMGFRNYIREFLATFLRVCTSSLRLTFCRLAGCKVS